MPISDFPKKSFSTQKVKRLKFSQLFTNQNFQNFQKTVYVVEPSLDISHAKFQAEISIFGKHIAHKPYPLMTSFFQTAIWSIPGHGTEKMTFWNPEMKLVQKDIFYPKNQFENLTL